VKITFLAPHTRISGGIKTIFRLAAGLQDLGHEVSVVVNKIKDPVMSWYPFTKMNFALYDARKIGGTIKKELYHRCDCIINFGDGPGIETSPAKKILFFQGFVTEDRKLERKNLRSKYDCIIVTSNWLYNIAKESGAKNIVIIPPGLDEMYGPEHVTSNRVPVIGGLYHTLSTKNVDMFSEIVVRLFTEYEQKCHALLVSSSVVPPLEKLEYYNIPYSTIVNPPVQLLPFVYSSCSVWVSTSKNEGFGLTNLEAMACKCPVVWMHNGGLQEFMKSGTNCIIISDVEGGAKGINNILSNEDLRKYIRKNGRDLALTFSWKKSIKDFDRVVRSIGKT